MIYTKEKFKELWDSNDDGGGITYDDIADCAKDWGICSHPKTKPILEVKRIAIEAAKCETIG